MRCLEIADTEISGDFRPLKMGGRVDGNQKTIISYNDSMDSISFAASALTGLFEFWHRKVYAIVSGAF